MRCNECGSEDTSLDYSKRSNSSAVDGRLRMREIEVFVYRGCNECSATSELMPIENFLERINNGP